MEKINTITTVVFDKTGTLTSGNPSVTDLISVKQHFKIDEAIENNEELFLYTYVVESLSEHPLAQAVVKKMEATIPDYIDKNLHKYSV